MRDAIVIGSGLAGLTAALRLAKGGKTVSLISKGPGGLQLSPSFSISRGLVEGWFAGERAG